jgi:cytoskeletal protein CcmA (bactofilin family)
MLGNKKTMLSSSGRTTLISRDTVIAGDIHFSGTLDIEGLVQGNIIALPGKDALVRVVEKGRVEGEIHAPSVMINGAIQGNVHCTKHLELAAKAQVEGNVFYNLVEMAAGSEVNGSLTHRVDTEASGKKIADPTVTVTEAGGGSESAGSVSALMAKVD